MATNCTVDFSLAACEGFPNARAALRTLLIEALDLGLQPEANFRRTINRASASTWLPMWNPACAALPSIQACHWIKSLQDWHTRVWCNDNRLLILFARPKLRRARLAGKDSSEGSPFNEPTEEITTQPQDDRASLQTRLLFPLMSGLNSGKIVLAEGGTGLGKSRVIARCALEYLAGKTETKYLILAPTVSVLISPRAGISAGCSGRFQGFYGGLGPQAVRFLQTIGIPAFHSRARPRVEISLAGRR